MEQNQEFDKYAKAKIEDPTLRLPEAMLKVNVDQSSGQLCYMKIFEEDTRRAQHLAESLRGGAKLDRKVHRIRNMELLKAIGENFEDMNLIHRVSKATIGLLVDSESDHHTHSFIDIVGTVEEVKMAEEFILDKILSTYNGPVFPVILMPPTIYGHEIRIHVNKVARLVGDKNSNILAMEVVSGAWLQIDSQPPPGCPKWARVLSIYGPKTNVVKAVSLVNSAIYEPGESLEAEKDLEILYKELTFEEVMKGMKPRSHEIIDQFESSRKQLLEEAKRNKESSSSGGDQSGKEKQDQQHEKDVEGSQDESKNKKWQHEEDVDGSQDESKDEKQQNEEDDKEAQSEKEKQQQLQVNEGVSSCSASGSRQVEEEKQQQHEEDVEGLQDESKDKNLQNEEDVIEAESEKEKQQKLQVKEAASSGPASASCQVEEEKQQQNEEDVEGSQDELKDQKQQDEEDAKEAVSVESSQQMV